MTKLSFVMLVMLVLLSSFHQPVRVVGRQDKRPEQQQSAAVETVTYPGSARMPEATERLNKNKPSSWLQADTYHTDDSLKEVIRHFKAQTEKLKRAHEPEGMAKSLMRDNWKVRTTTAPWAHSIFFVGDELKALKPGARVETTLGVMPLADSIVRVHLMSPHPASANNNELVTGTMITIVRERLQDENTATAATDEKVYKGADLTRRVRIISKPEAEHPGGRGHAVILQAILTSRGEVANIRVVGQIIDEFTREAIKAAKRIKFEPAIKDGQYVSQWVQLEYHFHP